MNKVKEMPDACKGCGGCDKCGSTHGISECIDEQRDRFYGDVFVYVPSARQILRVSEETEQTCWKRTKCRDM